MSESEPIQPSPDQTKAEAHWVSLMGLWNSGPVYFKELSSAYSGPDRHYHTLKHILNGLHVLSQLGADKTTKLAWWFHDVVYRAGGLDNEEASINLFTTDVYDRGHFSSYDGFGALTLEEVTRLIRVTKDHWPDPWDVRACHITIADLASLGAAPDLYAANAFAVRSEYADFPDTEWKVGRRSFLQGRLDRAWIFPPGYNANSLETNARRNMRRELLELNVV